MSVGLRGPLHVVYLVNFYFGAGAKVSSFPALLLAMPVVAGADLPTGPREDAAAQGAKFYTDIAALAIHLD